LQCLTALNGTTCSLGYFPECLTQGTPMLALADAPRLLAW